MVDAGLSVCPAVQQTIACFVPERNTFSSDGGTQNGEKGELVQAMDKRKNTSRHGNKCSLICYEILPISSADCVSPMTGNGSEFGQRLAVTSSPLLHSFKITCSLLITIRHCTVRSFPASEQRNSDTRTRRWSCVIRLSFQPHCLTEFPAFATPETIIKWNCSSSVTKVRSHLLRHCIRDAGTTDQRNRRKSLSNPDRKM